MSEDDIINQAINILESRLVYAEDAFTSPTDTKQYLTLKFNGLEHEVFRVLLLNNQHRLIESIELFRGTIDGASVHPREVVKAALKFNAAAIIFAHNHPSGSTSPSQADQRITDRLTSALKLIDVRVLDHIIVAGIDTYSFAEHGIL